MGKIITRLENFDHKRIKVTLDYDEVTFLLYKAEAKRLNFSADGTDKSDTLSEGSVLSDEDYRLIIDDILIPRAKKRILYYMKSGDKTVSQIKRKLKEGCYPEEVIREALDFLGKYGLADDDKYIENFAESRKSKHSRREIEAGLYKKGIDRALAREKLDGLLSFEDECVAAQNSLRAGFPRGVSPEDRNRAYAFLARKGFMPGAVEHALSG